MVSCIIHTADFSIRFKENDSMRHLVIILFIFLFLFSSQSQTKTVMLPRLSLNQTDDKTIGINKKLSLRYDSGGHVGIEYGKMFFLNQNSNENYENINLATIWLFDDFSIYKNIIGIKLKVGSIYNKRIEYKKTASYLLTVFVSGGINLGGLQFGRHFLSLYAGYMLPFGSYGSIIEINPKYVFKINKDIGLSAGMTCFLPGYNVFQLMPSIGFQYFY